MLKNVVLNSREWFYEELSKGNLCVVAFLKRFVERHPYSIFAKEMLEFWDEQEHGVRIIEENRDLIEESL